jgi:hypothetical protein
VRRLQTALLSFLNPYKHLQRINTYSVTYIYIYLSSVIYMNKYNPVVTARWPTERVKSVDRCLPIRLA